MKRRYLRWEESSQEEQLAHLRLVIQSSIKKQNDTGCWIWAKSLTRFGYGDLRIGGRKKQKHMNAHRVSWLAFKGEIGEGLFVCHRCDVRSCCNPDHLFLGTAKKNQHDMIAKGRGRTLRGEECSWAKLTKNDVLEILEMFKNGHNAHEVAKKFKIDRRHASDIKRGRRWSHVGDRSDIKRIKANKKILNEEKVREIKKRFIDGARICDIVREYNLSRSTVDDIKKNRTWNHVTIKGKA